MAKSQPRCHALVLEGTGCHNPISSMLESSHVRYGDGRSQATTRDEHESYLTRTRLTAITDVNLFWRKESKTHQAMASTAHSSADMTADETSVFS